MIIDLGLDCDLLRDADDPRWTRWKVPVLEWCRENLAQPPRITWRQVKEYPWVNYYAGFTSDSDALLFKLTWLG